MAYTWAVALKLLLTVFRIEMWSTHSQGIWRCDQAFLNLCDIAQVYGVTSYLLRELSPSWEAANCADTQEIPSILRNPKVHHRVHKSPPLVPTLSQIDPVVTIPSYLSKIYFNIVHPLRLGLPRIRVNIPRKKQISALQYWELNASMTNTNAIKWSIQAHISTECT
jgi:hypothetical protein